MSFSSNNLNQYVSIAESEDEFTPQFDDDMRPRQRRRSVTSRQVFGRTVICAKTTFKRYGDYNWYRLYGDNEKGGYTYDGIPVKTPDGTTVYRGNFNLHTGRASNGCVTVWSDVKLGEKGYPHSDDYDKLKKLLDKTKPLNYKNSNYTGWLEVK